MNTMRFLRAGLVLLFIGLAALWSTDIRRSPLMKTGMLDFGEIYYGARCALHHEDAYDPSTVLQEFKAAGGQFPADPVEAKKEPVIITVGVNLPTALFLTSPLARLPWPLAQTVWMVLTSLALALGAFLMWDLGGESSSTVAGWLACFMLLNCAYIFDVGNIAGLTAGLTLIAAWCFLRDRYALCGVVLLALGLVLKPHDAGFVWLCFLLAGGAMRKRALQACGAAGLLALASVLWISVSSPHWMQELHRNLAEVSVRGGTSDPSLSGITGRGIGSIIDLQSALSLLWNNPHFYFPAGYLLGGGLLLVWAVVVLRGRSSERKVKLALAAVSILLLLPIYHRPYDAKLIMLAIPACAMVWAEGGRRRWTMLAMTWAAVLATSDIPRALILMWAQSLYPSSGEMPSVQAGAIITAVGPAVLFCAGCYYLWLMIGANREPDSLPGRETGSSQRKTAAPAMA